MYPRIELIWLSETSAAERWTRGEVSRSAPTPWALARVLARRLPASDADGFLFWDPAIGSPDPIRAAAIFETRGDVWHGGLLLGTACKPYLIDFVAPAWPLNRDPEPGTEAISWRLSLRACLIRSDVLRALGGPDSRFDSLEMAGLELGHRYIRLGAIPRFVPALAAAHAPPQTTAASLADEMRLVSLGYGKFWAGWALARGLFTGEVSLRKAVEGFRATGFLPADRKPEPLPPIRKRLGSNLGQLRVSVILPTLDRYRYLSRVLNQLREQTVPASEIIIVDQTPVERRRESVAAEFRDLPLRVVFRGKPGQCSARNEAIAAARGDRLLFLDDDDEIPAGLIESHLRCLEQTGADGCCGVADEVGAGPLPHDFTYFRTSDVFPTNNAMLRRTALEKTGLFDLAYDGGELEDADLGMRLLLSGAIVVLNPSIRVLHHHAPRGGLRAHRARVVTYAMSRNSLFQRRLPSASEIYYFSRYFTPRQVRESLWLSVCGTFAVRGSMLRKLAKAAIAAVLLPSTLFRIREACKRAEILARSYPDIPSLPKASEAPAEQAPRRDEEAARAITA